jgi:hypothetical protein
MWWCRMTWRGDELGISVVQAGMAKKVTVKRWEWTWVLGPPSRSSESGCEGER